MWWGSAKKGIAYIDQGIVGILEPGDDAPHVSTCEEGSEFEFLEAVASSERDASWHLFLGPSLAKWRGLPRIRNVWRRSEQETAARALLSTAEGGEMAGSDAAVYVTDPAPQSQWVTYSITNETMFAARNLAARRKDRLRSVEPLSGAVSSGLEHATGLPHVLAMICARDVAWIVKDRNAVMDCGVWSGSIDAAAAAADCRRLQLVHAIPSDRVLILKLRLNSGQGKQSLGLSHDWRWTGKRFNAFWSVVEADRP